MKTLEQLHEIAIFLELDTLSAISSISSQPIDIYIPLVGEFNAGKTSLLNALLKSCQLSCSNIPTT